MNDDSLIAITRGDSKLMKDLLDVFISQNTTDLKLLEKAIENQDSHKCHYLVHKTKSSFKTLGFMDCFQNFNRLEIQLFNGQSISKLNKELRACVSLGLKKVQDAETYRNLNL